MFQKPHVCSRNTNQKLSRWLKVSVAAPAPARAVPACVIGAWSPVQGWDSGGHLFYCPVTSWFLQIFQIIVVTVTVGVIGVIVI